MTELGLTEPKDAEDEPVLIRRWIVILAASLLVPLCVALGTNVYGLNVRVSAIERTPESPKVRELELHIDSLQKMVDLYEVIRPRRERELAALEADVKNTQDGLALMRAENKENFDRLFDRLLGLRRQGP